MASMAQSDGGVAHRSTRRAGTARSARRPRGCRARTPAPCVRAHIYLSRHLRCSSHCAPPSAFSPRGACHVRGDSACHPPLLAQQEEPERRPGCDERHLPRRFHPQCRDTNGRDITKTSVVDPSQNGPHQSRWKHPAAHDGQPGVGRHTSPLPRARAEHVAACPTAVSHHAGGRRVRPDRWRSLVDGGHGVGTAALSTPLHSQCVHAAVPNPKWHMKPATQRQQCPHRHR